MNKKLLIILSILFVVSIFSNIALGFNVNSKSKDYDESQGLVKKYEKDIHILERKISEFEGIIIDDNLANDKKAKDIVKGFFTTHYEYNSATYKERFEKIKMFISDDVYGQLTAAGIPDIPNIQFENKINNMELYITAENEEISGLVLLDTVYIVDGLKSPEMSQIFRVSLKDDKITSLEALGTFAAMAES